MKLFSFLALLAFWGEASSFTVIPHFLWRWFTPPGDLKESPQFCMEPGNPSSWYTFHRRGCCETGKFDSFLWVLFTSILVIPLLVSRNTKDWENLVYTILLQTSGAAYITAACLLCLYSVPFGVSPAHWEFVMKKNLKCKLLPRPVRNI